ncbi:LPXTG cell wall anchor domain-containing protein [Furfurilactobacillus sp. WILCCON 0119]
MMATKSLATVLLTQQSGLISDHAKMETTKITSELPHTGETDQKSYNLIGVLLLSLLTAIGSVFGFRKRNLKH